MKSVFKPLVKNILITLGLTAAVSAANTGIQKKIFGSGTITLVVWNGKTGGIMKIVWNNWVWIKRAKGGSFGMLLGLLGASLLGRNLAGTGMVRAGEGVIQADEGTIRTRFLMLPHLLTNFEIKNSIKMNPKLIVFTQEIAFLIASLITYPK